jgi:hypothetical protein
MENQSKKLSEILIEWGKVTQEDVEKALEQAKQKNQGANRASVISTDGSAEMARGQLTPHNSPVTQDLQVSGPPAHSSPGMPRLMTNIVVPCSWAIAGIVPLLQTFTGRPAGTTYGEFITGIVVLTGMCFNREIDWPHLVKSKLASEPGARTSA